MTNDNFLEIWQETLNWQPNAQQQLKFQQLYELILEGNRQLNLTRITEAQEFWEKHLWDSLRGIVLEQQFIASVDEGASVIDIGTGAGFPGIPIAIAAPNWQVTLLDSTRKKINFIDKVLTELALDNAKTLVGRVEEIGQEIQHRQSYDVAVIRAVGSPSACAEYTLPLLKRGGLAVIYRGNWIEEETAALKKAVSQLGGKVEAIAQFTTPLSQSIRHCVYLRKIAATPANFPRAVGVPIQKPL
ncbi:16S rRNA (guanine(527)-N(7))-methyltransferase RsmG [Tolypothrix sp. FACHB-123]|uniref:16S rRNA (guanine(527)-N(7))-methyltransferase RsmG n=1 Tax=Tolypothrix sp. FACHB-123 TaxID=2692868 RepID=UPI0016883C8B|nr:16S rRNA (guanine(527)-N(7))-methyltransferase RsmG [Tolypothrix sp. FACHB-123]MBD2357831.1 16S rRNA (guanine(527)-N(7))-methyltransferase RsmG [Tolypothrix sp. FACHB-123]